MIALSLGLLAALGWSIHDLLAKRFAAEAGPFRLSLWILLTGALLLLLPVFWRGQIWDADRASVLLALATGVIYAAAIGGLLKAFSLAPVSIVGPFTAGYPALVVFWGLVNGLVPSPLQWSSLVVILAGVVIVGRTGPPDGGIAAIAKGKISVVVASCVIASFCFAAAIVMGQAATPGLGEYETTLLMRLPAAAVLFLVMAQQEPKRQAVAKTTWIGIGAMAICDVTAVTAINVSAFYPGREWGAMAIAAYGALSVLLAMVFLKEKVSTGQWAGILLVVAGVVALSI